MISVVFFDGHWIHRFKEWRKLLRFIYENLMIETNVIHAAYTHGVKKLLFLGSSCTYAKLAPQPLKEEYLLSKGCEVHRIIRKASFKKP